MDGSRIRNWYYEEEYDWSPKSVKCRLGSVLIMDEESVNCGLRKVLIAD